MISPPEVQTAIVQVLANTAVASDVLPLELSRTVPVPGLPSPEHVLVRVHAVALNPTDHKLVTHVSIPKGRSLPLLESGSPALAVILNGIPYT